MENRFFNIIENNLNLSTQETIVIAFSGGIDSSCLFDLLKKKYKSLVIAHFNHGLRESAIRDEVFARKTASQASLPFRIGREDVTKYANEMHYSIEESARKLRYKFLFQVAREFHSKYIVVAHHADDQVETILMHLFRGSGLSGLAGMHETALIPEFDSSIRIIRPLLSFWRHEIESYCKDHQVNYVIDETNLSNFYARNKLRNEIIPVLNREYPGLNERILSMANIVAKDEELLQSITEEKWKLICSKEEKNYIELNKEIFVSLPLAIQRRIIRKSVFSLKSDLRDLSFKNIDSVIHFLSTNKPGEIDLQENLIALVTSDFIYFGTKSKHWIDSIFPQLVKQMTIGVDQNSKIELSPNWIFSVEKIDYSNLQSLQPENDFSIYIDGGEVRNVFVIRKKKPGDKFQPLGFENGSMKVSDFFINEKLANPARANWPLVTSIDGEIIWIPGFRLDQKYKVSDQSTRILKLSIYKRE